MIHDSHEKTGGSPARTLPLTQSAIAPLRFELREHVRRLRLIIPVISVSIMALHRQNAELDYDIASVLSEHACQPLDQEVEHLAALLASLTCRSPQAEARV